MRTRTMGIIALAAIALFATTSFARRTPTTGPTATPSATTLRITGISRCVAYSVDRGFPKRGATQVDLCRGRSTGGPTPTTSIGLGRTTITGHPARNAWRYKATQEEYTYGVGAVRIALTGEFRIRGRTIVDKAQGTVIEGTGTLSGVTGTVTSTARNRVGARVFEYTSVGTYTFP